MATKPGGKILQFKEQIIDDPVTGLTFQFTSSPAKDAPTRLIVHGQLPYGSREFLFSADGEEVGAGTSLGDTCRPTWLREVT